MENIKFKINKIDKNNFLAEIKLPFSLGWITEVNLITVENNKKTDNRLEYYKSENDFAYFKGKIHLDDTAVCNYLFSYKVNDKIYYIKKDDISENYSLDKTWKINTDFKVPAWAKGKIMYHIFVDRFNKHNDDLLKEMPKRHIHYNFNEPEHIGPDEEGIWNNEFYGGNLLGIIDKLDYLSKLGVTILYLSPICRSQSNHRYDTSDYENVDPYVGCNDDLKLLCDKAHEMGMKVILDAVFNHTGNDSKYFNEYNTFDEVGAFNSNKSKYYGFYKKNKDGDFDYWWGMRNLPVCDGNSKIWKEYILGEDGVIDKWFNLGIDGLRLDVADELSDEFIEGIRESVKRNKEDGLIIGEVWKNPMKMNRTYLSSGKGMDSVMNYFFIDSMIRYFKYSDVIKLENTIKDILNEYPDETISALMNFTSTHDISRAIDIFSVNEFNQYAEWAWDLNKNDLEWCKNFKLLLEDYKKGKKLFKAYLFVLYFMPGIMSIFYGDEVGVEGLGNLANRKTIDWDFIDLDLLEYFRYLGRIRKNEKYLEAANLEVIDINDKFIMFERSLEKISSLTCVNRTDKKVDIILPEKYENSKLKYSLNDSNEKVLKPYGGINLVKKL